MPRTSPLLLAAALLLLASSAGASRALRQATTPLDPVAPGYLAYAAQGCEQDNVGSYERYTLRECMEKCTTRNCAAFIFTNTAPGDDNSPQGLMGQCKLYDSCDFKDARNQAQVLFVPAPEEASRRSLLQSSFEPTANVHAALPAQTCQQDNAGFYERYTLRECMEKCATRNCAAFVYHNTAPGDDNAPQGPQGLCTLYTACDVEPAQPADAAQVLFFPQPASSNERRSLRAEEGLETVARRYDAYPAQACEEDNVGSYEYYTLRECMEKCSTRDCAAFVFLNTAPGDDNTPQGAMGQCKLYAECEQKEARNGAQVLFVPGEQ